LPTVGFSRRLRPTETGLMSEAALVHYLWLVYDPPMEHKHDIALDAKVVELIRKTVRQSMQAYGFRDVSVRAGEDHEGDPVLFIEAEYDLTDTPIDTTVSASLTTKLRDKLWDAGEIRFPHIRHKFPEAQQVQRRHVKPFRRADA
jgi:hypothetical protein